MTKLERNIGSRILVLKYEGKNNYGVRLYVGVQSFDIGSQAFGKAEAKWMRKRLVSALVNLVNEVKP